LDAKNKNNAIDDAEQQNQHEQDINGIYLNMLENGLTAITADDIDKIETLANSCPMVKGTAVYKARTLNALFNPTQGYDDLKICNSQGVYKTSGTNQGYYNQESNYLQNLQAQKSNANLKGKELIVYPNPTDKEVKIKYDFSNLPSKIIITDILGRKRKEIDFVGNNNIISMNTSDLEMGIYTIKLIINNKTETTSKLIIE
jgi:hypothetical protein